MKPTAALTALVALSLAWPLQGRADQARDQADCSRIATQQTGFDPAHPPPVAQANPRVAGSGARARGAAAGAVIGGVAGDAGKGAAAGAVAGGVTQRSRNRRNARAANEAAGSMQAAYNQAMASCMAGRGYKAK